MTLKSSILGNCSRELSILSSEALYKLPIILKICSLKALYFYPYGFLQIRRNSAYCIVQSAFVKVWVLRSSYWNEWTCPRFFKISVPCILLISNFLWQAGIFYTRSLFNVIPNSANYNTIAIILSK